MDGVGGCGGDWLSREKPYAPEQCYEKCKAYKFFTVAHRDQNCKCANECNYEKHGHTAYEIGGGGASATTTTTTAASPPDPLSSGAQCSLWTSAEP